MMRIECHEVYFQPLEEMLFVAANIDIEGNKFIFKFFL